jgi:hypothetical protein
VAGRGNIGLNLGFCSTIIRNKNEFFCYCNIIFYAFRNLKINFDEMKIEIMQGKVNARITCMHSLPIRFKLKNKFDKIKMNIHRKHIFEDI